MVHKNKLFLCMLLASASNNPVLGGAEPSHIPVAIAVALWNSKFAEGLAGGTGTAIGTTATQAVLSKFDCFKSEYAKKSEKLNLEIAELDKIIKNAQIVSPEEAEEMRKIKIKYDKAQAMSQVLALERAELEAARTAHRDSILATSHYAEKKTKEEWEKIPGGIDFYNNQVEMQAQNIKTTLATYNKALLIADEKMNRRLEKDLKELGIKTDSQGRILDDSRRQKMLQSSNDDDEKAAKKKEKKAAKKEELEKRQAQYENEVRELFKNSSEALLRRE